MIILLFTIFEVQMMRKMANDNKKAVRRRLVGAYVSSVISISLVLLLVGIASFLIVNAGRVSEFVKENLQISILMNPEVSDGEASSFRAELDSISFIHSSRLVTKEEGEKELEEMLGKDFLSVFETSPVPVSVDVTLESEYVSPDSLGMVTARLEAFPCVDEVVCRQSLVEALNSNLTRISLVLGIFILLLLFVSFVLIGNTVRINVFARRFTIHTMKLVGATKAFILRPFLGGALIQAFVAALAASALLAGGVYYISRSLPQMMMLFSPRALSMVAVIIFVSSTVICVASTFFSINKLVSMSKDDLYY